MSLIKIVIVSQKWQQKKNEKPQTKPSSKVSISEAINDTREIVGLENEISSKHKLSFFFFVLRQWAGKKKCFFQVQHPQGSAVRGNVLTWRSFDLSQTVTNGFRGAQWLISVD